MFKLNGHLVSEEELIEYLNAHCRGYYDTPFRVGENCFRKSGHETWIIGGVGCEQAYVEKV